MKIRNVEGYRNYDKSEFAAAAPLADDDEMEKIWKKCHSLQAFLAPSNFKSYDELKAKLHKVLGLDGSTVGKTPAAARASASVDVIDELESQPAPSFKSKSAPKFDEEEDDDLAFFNNLAKD